MGHQNIHAILNTDAVKEARGTSALKPRGESCERALLQRLISHASLVLYTYHIILPTVSFNKSAPVAKHFSGGINTGNLIVPIWAGLQGVVQSEAT